MYWTFGYHQARWGYENISVVQGVVDGYREANIPLECLWNDLDIYDLYRDFTNNEATYPLPAFTNFIERLHANGQYYVPIIDSNIYVSNPNNASDTYAPFENGAHLETYIRDPTTGKFVLRTWHLILFFNSLFQDLTTTETTGQALAFGRTGFSRLLRDGGPMKSSSGIRVLPSMASGLI